MDHQKFDPKGLIRECYRIEGVTQAECKSILIDWALSLPEGSAQATALRAILHHYGAEAPDHPMTALLRQGIDHSSDATAPRRRGGRAARFRSD